MAGEMEIFAKFSADLWCNEKFCMFASRHARAAIVWVKAITFAVRKRSDGFFGDYAAKHFLGASRSDLEALETHGFIERVENGWMIHDYSDAQMSSREIDEAAQRRREAARKAGLASAAARQAQSETPTNVERTVERPVERPLNEPLNGENNDQPTEANVDIDIDKDIDTDVISPPTPSRDVQRPDVDRVMREVGSFYPDNRFDGAKGAVRFDLEAQWPRIVKAAGGVPDVEAWFIERTRAYVQSQDEQYVKKFSRYLGGEDYTTAWKPAKPRQAPPSKQMLNREHNWRLAVSLMTDEEKRKYGITEGDHGQPV